MADVKLSGVHKYYGNVHAVRGVDLTITDGEFAVLVGPSGCGKSTLLRTIAGLKDPDHGTITIGGAVVNDLRPRERNIAMVFQNYALYPYLTVNENIGFGLRARKTPEMEIRKRVSEAAEARHRQSSSALSSAALRRTASAGRHRPGHRPQGGPVPVRRAALKSRRPIAR